MQNRTRLTQDEIRRGEQAGKSDDAAWRRRWLDVTNSADRRKLEAFAKGDGLAS